MVRGWPTIWVGACAAMLFAGPMRLTAQPAPVVGQPVRALPAPTDMSPLPTDGLMGPRPAVPPRSSYQIPPVGPFNPPLTPPPNVTLPSGTNIPVPAGGVRNVRWTPRYGIPNNFNTDVMPDGTRRFVFTGGLIVNVGAGQNQPEMEFATDDAVIWVRNAAKIDPQTGVQVDGQTKTEVELYLAGNVVIRTITPGKGSNSPALTQTLRAEEIYYDVAHSRAIALAADLELNTTRVPDSVHMRGREIRRLDVENWEILHGSTYSSKLPSDPGLKFDSPRSTLRERRVTRTNIFGIPYRDFDGNTIEGYERILTSRNVVTRLNGLPVFYSPYVRFDATDPLGPLTGIGFGQDRIFGTQFYTTWDLYELVALRPPPGHRWRLHLDYLSDRGPAIGTDYLYQLQPREDGFLSPGRGFFRAYGLSDGGVDVLGGDRGPEPIHPGFRGRVGWRHMQDLDDYLEGLYFQGQLAYISDYNFLEQFYKTEWDLGPNQETFAYLTWQRGNFWSSGLVMPRFARPWIAQTAYLPRLDGALIGQSFWDLFVYNSRANATYAQGHPSETFPGPMLPTDRNINAARLDLNQEISLPFDLGPFKLAPYGTLDLAYYSKDLTGSDAGRVLGGGGVRSSVPFSRLYEGAASELFNVRGLYHKVMVGANYYYAQSNIPYSQLPMLDRLNDDAVDQGYRNIRPFEPMFLPGAAGNALAFSPIFNPQQYLIRRLVDTRSDTLDSIQVLQADVRQRFQTKRGYPGLEHTVDAFVVDVSASYFPQANRDNYGKPFSFLEYGTLWNIGDRVAMLSNGWFDPFDQGTRYYNVGASLDRPDRTSYYFGYRQTDPLNSKQVTASLTYQMNRRYYMSVGVSYDFGIQQAMSNSFSLTRTGSDLTVTIGFTYNALVNNFGFQFLVLPNAAAALGMGRFGSLNTSGLVSR